MFPQKCCYYIQVSIDHMFKNSQHHPNVSLKKILKNKTYLYFTTIYLKTKRKEN